MPYKERVLKLLRDISLHHGIRAVHPASTSMVPVVYDPDEDERKGVKYAVDTGRTDVKSSLL